VVLASLLAGFGLLTHLVPSVGAAARSLSLYGTAAGGWSFTAGTETNPGPTITANVGDNLTVHMISEDGAEHGVFIDLNDDGHIDLFVGRRAIAGKYGLTPRSYLLQNDGTGHFPVAGRVERKAYSTRARSRSATTTRMAARTSSSATSGTAR